MVKFGNLYYIRFCTVGLLKLFYNIQHTSSVLVSPHLEQLKLYKTSASQLNLVRRIRRKKIRTTVQGIALGEKRNWAAVRSLACTQANSVGFSVGYFAAASFSKPPLSERCVLATREVMGYNGFLLPQFPQG